MDKRRVQARGLGNRASQLESGGPAISSQMKDPAATGGQELDQCQRKVVRVGRASRFVGDDIDAATIPKHGQDGSRKVLAWTSPDPGGAGNREGRVGREDRLLARQLTGAVDRKWMWQHIFGVRRAAVTREDEVGAHGNQVGTVFNGGRGDEGRTRGVDGHRQLRLPFAAIDISVGGGVDDRVWPGGPESSTHRLMILDIRYVRNPWASSRAKTDHAHTRFSQAEREEASELASGARHEHPLAG